LPPNKEMKFKVALDEQSFAQVRRAIRELLSDATKLAQVLNGGGGGRPGGGLLGGGPMMTGTVGGSQSNAQMLSGAGKPGAGPQALKSPLASVFIENASALKGLASVSRDSMRVMTDGISRGVEQQRRAIRDLDADLAKLTRRYEELGNERGAAIVGGVSPAQANAAYQAGTNQVFSSMASVAGQRSVAAQQLQQLQQIQAGAGGSGGGSASSGASGFMGIPFRNSQGQLFRGKFAAGAAVAGLFAGADEIVKQPFDLVTNAAKQAQSIGTMGVATKQGDLSFALALMQVARDPNMRREFGQIGGNTRAYAVSGAGRAIGSGLTGILQGNVPNPGDVFRAFGNLDTRQKEAIRSYVDQVKLADPQLYANLATFQGGAAGNLGLMRQMGMSDVGLTALAQRVGYGSGQDRGDIAGAFGSLRGAGRGFARGNLGLGLAAMRGGMDMGAFGDLAGAAASGGSLSSLFGGLTSGIDVVAAEALSRAAAGAIRGSGYGAAGDGLLGPLTSVGFGGRPEVDVYRAQQRGAALSGVASLLGGSADPFGTGINVLTANRIVGPGGDMYQARALAQLGGDPAALADAMAGKDPSGLLRAQFGQDFQSQATRMFQESITRNVRSRFISGAGGGSPSPATATMQRLVDSYGGDIGAMLRQEGASDDLLNQLGVGMSEILPQTFASAAQGREAAAMIGGFGAGGRRGRGLGDSGAGTLTGKFRAGVVGASEEEMNGFLSGGEGAKLIAAVSGIVKEAGDAMVRAGGTDRAAEQAGTSLLALVTAADRLRESFNRMSSASKREILQQTMNAAAQQAENARAVEAHQASDHIVNAAGGATGRRY
jgi:hypothetical protein